MLPSIVFAFLVFYAFQLGVLFASIINGWINEQDAIKIKLIFFIPFLPLIVGLYLKSKERSWK